MIWSAYQFKFFKFFHQQILFGPFLNTQLYLKLTLRVLGRRLDELWELSLQFFTIKSSIGNLIFQELLKVTVKDSTHLVESFFTFSIMFLFGIRVVYLHLGCHEYFPHYLKCELKWPNTYFFSVFVNLCVVNTSNLWLSLIP